MNDSLTNAPHKTRHEHPTAQEAKHSQTRVPHDERPSKVERLSVSHPPPPNIYQQKIDGAYDDRDVPSPRHPAGGLPNVEPSLNTVHERDQASHAVRPVHASIRHTHSGLTHSSSLELELGHRVRLRQPGSSARRSSIRWGESPLVGGVKGC